LLVDRAGAREQCQQRQHYGVAFFNNSLCTLGSKEIGCRERVFSENREMVGVGGGAGGL